ncbi:MAG: hypothetical protein ACOC80_12585 [Petrotogales bacterium]
MTEPENKDWSMKDENIKEVMDNKRVTGFIEAALGTWEVNIEYSERLDDDEMTLYQDPSHVIGLIPKMKKLDELFDIIFNDKDKTETPNLNYDESRIAERSVDESKGLETKGRYSGSFLLDALQVMDQFMDIENNSVTIRMGTDYPIVIENRRIAVVLAPRMIERENKHLIDFKEQQEDEN